MSDREECKYGGCCGHEWCMLDDCPDYEEVEDETSIFDDDSWVHDRAMEDR